MMHEINDKSIENIKYRFPGIIDCIHEKMHSYFDDETDLRIRFLSNVPLFRGQDQETLYKMHYLTRDQNDYKMGEIILD